MASRSVHRILRRAAWTLLALVLLLLGGGLYWLGTPQALEWLTRQAIIAGEGRLAIEGAQGSLYSRINISRVAYKDAALDLEARSVTLEWQPQAILIRQARITALSIDELRVAATASDEPARLPATLKLPFDATVTNAEIKRLEIVPASIAQDLRFNFHARAASHELELANVSFMDWRAAGAMRLGTAAPFTASGKLNLSGKALDEPLAVGITIGGSLDALQLQAAAAARGTSAKAAGLLRPFAEPLIETLTLDTAGLDLAAWDRTLPQTRLDLTLEAGMPRADLFKGKIRARNSAPGPVDTRRLPLTHAGLEFSGNGAQWTLSDIVLGVGAGGQVRGSGAINDADMQLNLALSNIKTAALHSGINPLTVSGTAILTGNVEQQRVVAELEGDGAQLAVTLRQVRNMVTVERGRLRAGKGQFDFTGHAALADAREFSLKADFSAMDPSRFVNAPKASLNGKLSVQGRLAPAWQAQVQLALTNSRLREFPLSANAGFTTAAKQLFAGKAHAILSGNRIDIAGSFGEPRDRLNWSIDAANLQAFDKTLAGTVKGQGTLAGNIEQPSVDFRLTAQRLVAGGFSARSLDAQGTLDAGVDGALKLKARGAGIKARTMAVDEVKLDVSGTRLRHEVKAALHGKTVNATLNGAGALESNRVWNGSVSALQIRGDIPFDLVAPARISIGHDLLIITDVQAVALGGKIGPASFRMEQGGITTNGALTGITSRALLALIPKTGIDPRDLTVGGHWNFTLKDTVSGSAEIYRESGDLGVLAERTLQLGLQQLRVSITASDNALDAGINAQSTHMGTLTARARTQLERRGGAWVLARNSPLEGAVNFDMQSLAWARILAPELDRTDGRVAAQLTIAGTAGAPLISGDLSADAVQVRSISTGLNLTDGTLRANFDGQNLKVSRFHVKAGDGKIEADGAADLADGLRSFDISVRAERARILASPELTVVLSGAGRAGLRELKLAIDGKFRVDEGRYDLGVERRPVLGEDVVIVGKSTPAAGAKKPVRIALDMTVDLNDKFAVRGYGLNTVLGGSLNVTSRNDAYHALGTIRTLRGEYYAFGQRLDIERGELTFSGPLGNPGLNLRAGRKIKSVEVGVEVSGSLQRPLVKLVSDPDMSDSDRLAWLVLGRDPQTASAAELAILQATALSAGSRSGNSIQKQVADGLGLDELGVSQGGEGALGVVTLGKRITDQLTARLEQTLGGTAGSVVKVDYLLSERWRLEATTGAENALDVLFTLRFD
ncbi:MAG: translocation/assembly module TamB domain-containing protein [Betaproteobacteria bacterium]|nr:translocation/assembly module TamB domain-containing protein [Betaproteobacteria bacterium]